MNYKYFSSLFLDPYGKRIKISTFALLCTFIGVLICSAPVKGAPIDISDVPLDSQLSGAAPNLMFGLDDSGSMDWEILTSESDGLFEIGSTDYTYVFDDPGDNLYTSGTYSDIITGTNRQYYKSQWSGYNVMYYDPTVTYTPWQGFPNENVSKPRSHPYYNSTAPSGNQLNAVVRPKPYTSDIPPANFLDLSATYVSIADEIIVDNQDGGAKFSKTGTWVESGSTPEYASSSIYTQTIGDKATFTPNIVTAANYDVYAWWNCYNNRDTNAKITIIHSGGTTDIYKDQRWGSGACGQWVHLGSYSFASGTAGKVSIERHALSTGDSTVADAVKFVKSGAVDIKNAHYYKWNDTDNDSAVDSGEIYLVNLDGAITYYQFTDADSDNKVDNGELVQTLTPPNGVLSSRTYAAEIQNFANWYTFYRKRRATAVASISTVIPKLQGVNVGFRSINGHILSPVLPVNVNGVDSTSTLLDLLFSYHQGGHVIGATPLRLGLENIGKYFDTAQTISPAELALEDATKPYGTSPIDTGAKGECQQNFAIMFTDGAYNGLSPGLGNVDGGKGKPYEDTASNTLADVAYYYWQKDLAPNTADNVPQNFYDKATWQHMVTYTVAFGVTGTLNMADYDLYNTDLSKRKYPTWPSPINSDAKRIDDLWHAAVNGRAKYLNAQSPAALNAAFEEVINDVLSRIGSASSVSINGDQLYAGSVVYQSRYSTDGWTGDVLAYNLDTTTGVVITVPEKWSASAKLDAELTADPTYWNTKRVIATYNGTTGKPFRYTDFTAAQKALLDADMVNYIRGDHSKEVKYAGGVYRNRELNVNGAFVRNTLLADIVHSSPLYYNSVIYAGGNDGMLHAFDATTGAELFVYVPNLVFANLPQLTSPAYSHKFFVDLTPVAQDIGTANLLVGGLGKGGKGYYCIDVTDPASVAAQATIALKETTLASMVKWEYPNAATPAADTADMGYSFSKAYIVKSHALDGIGNKKWVAIFGNGYNSTNESSVLFILDALTGDLIKKIDTGVKPSNGLSTPAPVDVNGDSIVDYVYAGDLQGNMWKFDLTSSTVANWNAAYDPQPLFRAMDGAATPNYQPITSRPDVTVHNSKPGYIVVFGTGKYLGASDLGDTKTQSIYGIWDYGDDIDNSEYVGSFQRADVQKFSNINLPNTASLLEQTIIYEGQPLGLPNKLRVFSNNSPLWDTVADVTLDQNPDPIKNVGWYIDLPTSKERVAQDLMIRNGKVIVTSIIPQSNSPCTAGGESWLMEFDAYTGGRLSTSQLDINNDGTIDDSDLITIPDPNNPGQDIIVPVSGIGYGTVIYPPAILGVPGDDEIKYFSTAAGNIIMVREKGKGTGMLFWRKF